MNQLEIFVWAEVPVRKIGRDGKRKKISISKDFFLVSRSFVRQLTIFFLLSACAACMFAG
jgi:hypothetical protein